MVSVADSRHDPIWCTSCGEIMCKAFSSFELVCPAGCGTRMSATVVDDLAELLAPRPTIRQWVRAELHRVYREMIDAWVDRMLYGDRSGEPRGILQWDAPQVVDVRGVSPVAMTAAERYEAGRRYAEQRFREDPPDFIKIREV